MRISPADSLLCSTPAPPANGRTRSHMQSTSAAQAPPTQTLTDDGPSALNQAFVSVRVGPGAQTLLPAYTSPFSRLPAISNFSSLSRDDPGGPERATRGSEFISSSAGVTLPRLPVASRNQLRTLINWSPVGAVCVCTRRTEW